MKHWQRTYLGIRLIPRELKGLERATIFHVCSQRAFHPEFPRMSCRTLDAYQQILRGLWSYLSAQRSLVPADLDTSCMLYESRAHTLIDYQAPRARHCDSARWPRINAATF
jgi:hypothetical protein